MAGAFDLVIIGAGTAGRAAAGRAARLGLRTALIEKEERLGGASLLKYPLCRQVLLEAAAGRRRGSAEYDWTAVTASVEAAARRQALAVARLVDRLGLTVLHGQAHLDGPGKVVVAADQGSAVLTADKVIVAAGSLPAGLPGVQPDGHNVFTADQLADLKELPTSLIVVGAGATGVELAGIMQTLGSRVTLVEMQDAVLPWLDPTAGVRVDQALGERGVRVLTGHKARQVRIEDGGVRCAARCLATGRTAELAAAGLLLAVGRRPATGHLGLETCDAVRDKRGFIQTDGFMASAEPGHYAVGGVVATPALSHVAAREGWIAAGHAAGQRVLPLRYHQIPQATVGIVEAAAVGLTETEAIAAGHAVRTGVSGADAEEPDFSADDHPVFAKIIADDPSGMLLGVHLVGPGAGMLIGEAATALGLGAQLAAWSDVFHPRTALADAVTEALLAAAAPAAAGG